MKLKNSIPALLAVICMSFALNACVTAPPARRHALVEIDVRPPPARVVEVPPPRRGYIWASGYWRWNGRKHDWVDGRWIRERRGYHWVPDHWEEHNGRWHFEDGHWER